MTEHPITPPPELVQKWFDQAALATNRIHCIATRAAQWGADQELEACCEWLDGVGDLALQLRTDRRPKPPSLKERALKGLDIMIANGHLDAELAAAIREVLEASHD
jgi:hypothetical protein